MPAVFADGRRPTAVDGPALEDEARAPHVGFWVDGPIDGPIDRPIDEPIDGG